MAASANDKALEVDEEAPAAVNEGSLAFQERLERLVRGVWNRLVVLRDVCH
jgi:hypothetical protein